MWSSKVETLKYLNLDLLSLYEVIKEANKYLHRYFDINFTKCLTVSSITYDIFFNKYYDNNIPLINDKVIYNDIRNSYFGGITEVYKPTNDKKETFYYYDVNSLYPYVSFNDMPGLNCKYKEFINYDKNLDDTFGFYYCDIDTPPPLIIFFFFFFLL